MLEDRRLLTRGAYIDSASHVLTVFNPANDVVLGTVAIPASNQTLEVVVSPDESRAYVSDFSSARIWEVNINTLTLVASPISVATNPEDLAITQDGMYLLVTDGGGVSPICVVNTATRAQVSSFNTGSLNNAVAVEPGGNVVVADHSAGQVRRLSLLANGTLVNTNQTFTLSNAFNVVFAPNGNVGVAMSDQGQIASFRVGTMSLINTRSISSPISGVFSAAGDHFYVRSASGLISAYTFDQTTGQLGALPQFTFGVASASTFFGVDQLALSSDGSKLYVTETSQTRAYSTVNGAFLHTLSAGSAQVGIDVAVANQAPSASAGGSYSIAEGSNVTLSGSGSDPDGTIAAYEWDLNYDGVTFTVDATGASPTFSAAALDGPSTRTVALRVRDNSGANSAISTALVIISNVPPSISGLTAISPVKDGSPTTVTLNATDPAGVNDTLSYSFDFNLDGMFEAGPQSSNAASHTFASPGTYIVAAKVSDDDGALGRTALPSSLISWWNSDGSPDDSADGNGASLRNGVAYAAGKVGQAFSFDGVNDYVTAGSPANLVLTNSGTISAWIFPTGPGSDPTDGGGIIVNKEGEYEFARFADGSIQWAINDGVTWRWIDTGFVAPLNQWTHLAFTYDHGLVKTYANGQLVHQYAISGPVGDLDPVNNEFRIGGRPNFSQYFQGRIDEVSVYSAPLSDVEVRNLNYAGNAGLHLNEYATTTVRVNAPPTATAGGPYSVAEGSNVTIAGSGSDPDGTVAAYEWDLNYDGVTFTVGATGTSPTFSAAGLDGPSTRTVALRVRDNDGANSAVSTAVVRITNVPPTLTLSGAANVNEGSLYTLSLAATDPGPDTISSWSINWGDGSLVQTVPGNASSATHVYADGTRNFTILATATDEDGTYTARAAGSNAQASLDPSFATAGEVVQNLNGFTGDYVRAALVSQPDGKLLAVGYTQGGTNRIAMARYNTDGSLDATFGTGGTVVTEFGTSAVPVSAVLDGNGNILVAGSFGLARYSAAGVLDTSFGNSGRITSFQNIQKALRDANGSILVGDGSRLARFLPSGAFDLTFGSGGITPHLGYNFQDFTLAPDGKIITVEDHYNGYQTNQYDIIVRRYLTNGQADSAFGQSGQYLFDNGGYSDYASQIAIQQGKILVGGYSEQLVQSNPNQLSTLNRSVLLFRLDADGQLLDPSFGTGGKVLFRYNNTTYDYFYGMGVDASDRILVSGTYGLYRFSSAGVPDTAFGGSGYAIRNINNSSTKDPLLFGSGGLIYLGGYSFVGSEGANFGVQRFLDNGSRDNSFDFDSVVQTGFQGPLGDYLRQVTVRQTDGKIVVAGYSSGGTTEMVLARYLPAGQPDASFGNGGLVRTGVSGSTIALATAADGTVFASNGNYLYHFLANGDLDTTTTPNGFTNGQRYAEGVYVQSLKLDAAGQLLAAGYRWQSTGGVYSYDFAVARFSSTGVVDNGYGSGGVASFDLGTTAAVRSDQVAYGMALDASGRAVVVGYTNDYTFSTGQYSNYHAVIARFTTSGQLDPTFNPAGGGVLQTVGGDNSNYAQTVAVDSLGRIVVGFNYAIHRYDSTGALDTSFSGDGIASNNNSYISALGVDSLNRVVTGAYGYLARLKEDGSADLSFGPSGRISTGARNSNSLAFDDSNRIVAAGYADTGGSNGADYWLARYITDGLAVTVNNVAPQNLTITGPISANEGSSITLGASATDPAGVNDPLTYSWNITRNGSPFLQISGASINFGVPDNGTYVASVTVADGDGGTASASRTIAVSNVAPTGTFNVPATAAEGSSINISLTDAADVSAVDAAGGFTYAFDVGSGYGSFSSTATANFTPADNGSYSVKGKIRDKDGGITEYTATVVVTNVAPQNVNAGADQTVNEGDTVNLSGSFTDPGTADTHTQNWTVVASNGQVVPAGSGSSFSFVPNDNGTYTVTYTVTDDDVDSTSDTVVVTVNNVAPQNVNAGADQTVNEGDTVSLSGSFTDPGTADTQTQSWTVVASNGQVVPAGSGGLFSFVPNDNGTYTVTYTVTDDDGDSTSDTVVVTVNNVAPQNVNAGADQTVNEGDTVNLSGSFTDPGAADTHTQSWTVVASNGQVVPAGSGGSFSFVPNDNGTYAATYTVTDDDGGTTSDTVVVTVNNVAPQNVNAGSDQTVNEGDTVSLGGSFTDPGAADTHTESWSVVASSGQVVPAGSGSLFSFVPNDNGTYTVTYTVTDDDGDSTSDTVVVTVNNVAPQNVKAGADQTVNEGDTVGLSGSFTDPGAADTHTQSWTVVASNGQAVPAGSGSSFSFVPNDNGTYTVTYTVTDDDGDATSDTVVVTVNNVAPQNVNAGADQTVNEGDTVSLSGSFTDPGAADTHTQSWVVASNGRAVPAGGGSLFSFVPNDNGTYTVTYTVTDDDGDSTSDTVVVTVNNVAPQNVNAGADQTVNEGDSVSLSGSFTDPGTADTHTQSWTVVASNGQAVPAGSGGSFTFVPNDNGTYTVIFTVTDDDGDATSDTVVVTVNNVAPQNVNAGADQTVNEGDTVSLSGSFTDSGAADTHTQSWTVVASNGQAVPAGSGGSFTFVPNDNGTYTVTYTVTDDDGDSTSDTVVVTVNNVAPIAVPDTNQTNENTSVATDVIANDSDVGNADVLSLVGSSAFIVSMTRNSDHAAIATSTASVSQSGNSITFNPCTDFDFLAVGESATVVISYAVTDDDGGTSSSLMTVTVNGVNDAPTAVDDSTVVHADGTVTINVLANDWDTDASDVLSVASYTPPANGTVVLNSNGTFTYTPGIGCDCTGDSFSYTISDGHGGTATATVTITITPYVGVGSDGGILRVGGGSGADVVSVSGGNLVVNGTAYSLAGITEVRVWGYGGNDSIDLGGLAIKSFIDGGSDDDTLTGGSADDVIFGGLGNDTITGSAGNDLLVGGQGKDRIVGSAGNDILVAGEIACDLSLGALRGISAAWAADKSVTQSDVNDLIDEESVDAAFDMLTGSSGADWFIVGDGDKITDLSKTLTKGSDGDVVTYV